MINISCLSKSASGAKQFGLGKALRLSVQQDIKAIFDNANAVRHPNLVLLGKSNELSYPRITIIVAKKNVKKANQRNRLKRLIRESFRLTQHPLAGNDFIVIVKQHLHEQANPDILAIMGQQWERYLKRYKKLG